MVSAPAVAVEYLTEQLALAAPVTGSVLPLPSVHASVLELPTQLAFGDPVAGSTAQPALLKLPPAPLVNVTVPVGILAEPTVLSVTVAEHVIV